MKSKTLLPLWSLNAHRQATEPNGPGALGPILAKHARARAIRFEKKGDLVILGRRVPFYMADDVDEHYEERVTDIVTKSIDLLNEKAGNLTAEDEDAIAHVNVIAAVKGLAQNEWFLVEGIDGSGPGAIGASGINLHSGVFFDYIFNDIPKYWAPMIAHEGQHRKDFMKKTGAHAPWRYWRPRRVR